jgi:hypothetical protein
VVEILALREFRRRAQRQATARTDEACALPHSFRALYARDFRSAKIATRQFPLAVPAKKLIVGSDL